MDETASKSYVEHLEFLDAKAKKKVRERNALPPSISWKNEKDVEALTNNQLKMYLKQRDLKISGSMADFTRRVASHARGKTTQFQNPSHLIPMERTHTSKSHLKYFLCLRKTSNTQIRYEITNAGRKQGRGGGGLTLILSVGEGRLKLIST